jgi:hypothetical protein
MALAMPPQATIQRNRGTTTVQEIQVITISICDPGAQEPFSSFVHHTTTYVSVPHDAASQLWVEADGPSKLVIQSCGQPVKEIPFDRSIAVPLSEIRTNWNQSPGLVETATNWLRKEVLRRPAPCRHPSNRLYDFTVEVRRLRDDAILGDAEVHILCPIDFKLASELHLLLQERPDALSPDTIAQRAEGKACPQCAQLSAQLKSLED